MKQTAVEWLKVTVKSMIENGEDADLYAVLWHIEQAKEMEREQMDKVAGDWWNEGASYMYDGQMKYESFEQYYKETFNTNG